MSGLAERWQSSDGEEEGMVIEQGSNEVCELGKKGRNKEEEKEVSE